MRKIIFLVTEDWYFLSHRLPIARVARDAGFEVVVATRVANHGDNIRLEGFRLVPLKYFKREHTNPWQVLREIIEVSSLYRKENPTIVHHVAIKPVVVGSIATRLTGVNAVVNAVAGLGFVFASCKLRARLIRPVLKVLLRFCLKHSIVIVQNPDDEKEMVKQGLIHKEQSRLILGSGVDVDSFQILPDLEGIFTVALVSRMLWDKGVGEFISAIRLLRNRGVQVRAILAGKPDLANLNSISSAQLQHWHDEGIAEWLGYVEDIRTVWAQAHVAVLPSYYREGVPKCLLEAAACGRPIVTTDMPGCREIVHHGENGLLVPVRDASGLADAMHKLLLDAELRRRMGRAGRSMVEQHFSEQCVADQTLRLYGELCVEAQS